jgi:phosphoribosylaminoimidazole-succinocarboxamide synthase
MELVHSGKVRDIYADGDDLILVASDRVSVFDVVLPTPIPDKGKVLTQLSLWWFERLTDIAPNHVISATDVPDDVRGRAIRCQKLSIVPVECITRGYLTGTGRAEYEQTGQISGQKLEPGLREADQLPEPLFTPTTKAPIGQHDQFMTYEQVVEQEGAQTAGELRRIALAVYARGAEIAGKNGIIIADTKVELGRDRDGRLILADEVLTPDSSRFWAADQWQPGQTQYPYDKQFVRDWAASTGWNKQSPGPEIPDEIVEATRARYIEAYELITGEACSL